MARDSKRWSNVRRLRRDFSRIKKVLDVPDLIALQKESYGRFVQKDIPPEQRENVGIQGVFNSVFPIKSYNEQLVLQFESYSFGEPKYDVEECLERGFTYAAPLKVIVRLEAYDVDEKTSEKYLRDIKRQEMYFGEIPLITDRGTFIINGTERVVVSQLHRSPGVFFGHDKGKTHISGKKIYSARVIPYRGSWLDFEFDLKDIVHAKIDRRRRLLATVLLKAIGYREEEILNRYYDENYKKDSVRIDKDKKRFFIKVRKDDLEFLRGNEATCDVRDKKGKIVVKRKVRFNAAVVKRIWEAGIEEIPMKVNGIVGRHAGSDIVNMATGEVLCQCSEEITPEIAKMLLSDDVDVSEFELLVPLRPGGKIVPALLETLKLDPTRNQEEAMIEIYHRMRPGDTVTVRSAETFLRNLFFNPDRYDLSKVGRKKINDKLGLDLPLDQCSLTPEDVLQFVYYLMKLRDGGEAAVDDVDHLGNRRVRAVGELVENHFRSGLVRMARAVKERMAIQEIDALVPYELLNAKPVQAAIREFFASSQLSQFMDQTNPLSEITHKRRLSALGPGGLTRERAGFEVRDVHPTHYGRICPIETPEGPNIGLIASLTTHARVNDLGLIETPYRKVVDGAVTNEIEYLTATQEERFVIAQANAPVDERGRFFKEMIAARRRGEFAMVEREEINYMDVTPQQVVSVAASLIPFLEHDDANRALMGSNMQRQAVPLMRTEAPLVGTGMEEIVARHSGATVVAKRSGVVESVDATRVVIKVDERERKRGEAGVDIYNLVKYQRTNQNTSINQKPVVRVGERVAQGEVIADGTSTAQGELALGRNVLVAFMPWGGYNFEDSMLISERLVKDDAFTSIHIEVMECVARDTKFGKEEITRDIPNVSEEMLRNMDDSGIVRIGAEVKPGDIVVGKITPREETQLSPEEKLLQAIFGEKAKDVKNTSQKVPAGIYGTVIDAKVFTRRGTEKDKRAKQIEDEEIARIIQDRDEQIRILEDGTRRTLKEKFLSKVLAANLSDKRKRKVYAKKGQRITEDLIDKVPLELLNNISLKDEQLEEEIKEIISNVEEQIDLIRLFYDHKVAKVKKSDEMPPGVIKMVKVYIAMKRRLQVGDKMAGRHGNKGVLSVILPEEDMPYLPDGTPVQMVLNPLGVPSRMNVGQILEAHLGWAVAELSKKMRMLLDERSVAAVLREEIKKIYGNREDVSRYVDGSTNAQVIEFARRLADEGIYVKCPVFDGARESEISEMLEAAGLPANGQTVLFDGRTGEPFDREVTVGVMYMIKLHHLVEDKIHARATGPYSLVTQQPLGGKAQFGGQRLGEMEVWAIEAYGSAFSLQEFLTVKSDDVPGRMRMFDAIVRGTCKLQAGLPESFKVMVNELKGLALDIELLEKQGGGEQDAEYVLDDARELSQRLAGVVKSGRQASRK